MTPETDIGAALAASASWTPKLVEGTDFKYGPEISPKLPGGAGVRFWIMPYGGPAPEGLLNAPTEGSEHEERVQILCLSKPNDFLDGITNARLVRDALNRQAPAGYGGWYALGEPIPMPPNEAGQFRFAVNIRTEWIG